MRRIVGIVTLGASVLVACSGGGGAAAPTTTTASASATTTTTTVAATTTTVAPEQALRRDWDRYWAMVVRLSGAPDATDTELGERAIDPILSALKDQLSTRASQGHRVVIPENAKYRHVLETVTFTGAEAAIKGCQIDDSITVDSSGALVDGSVETRTLTGTFVLAEGTWKASDITFTSRVPGVQTCGE